MEPFNIATYGKMEPNTEVFKMYMSSRQWLMYTDSGPQCEAPLEGTV